MPRHLADVPASREPWSGYSFATRSDKDTTRKDDATPAIDNEVSATATTAHARAVREAAAALRAESRQARRQAAALREDNAAILESVMEIAGEVLQAGGFAVAAPVDAKFRTGKSGSTGVEIRVRLQDPGNAGRAAAALAERFGDTAPPDAITVR